MKPDTTSHESRKSKRVPVEAFVAFSGVEIIGEGQGTLFNLSSGGCAIHSKTVVSPGTYLSLRVHLPDRDDPLMVPIAVVRWASPQRFGVQFMFIQPDDAPRLSRMLEELDSGKSAIV